jgi:hypothetical protein
MSYELALEKRQEYESTPLASNLETFIRDSEYMLWVDRTDPEKEGPEANFHAENPSWLLMLFKIYDILRFFEQKSVEDQRQCLKKFLEMFKYWDVACYMYCFPEYAFLSNLLISRFTQLLLQGNEPNSPETYQDPLLEKCLRILTVKRKPDSIYRFAVNNSTTLRRAMDSLEDTENVLCQKALDYSRRV